MRALNTLCQRFHCDHMGNRICCASCENYGKCKNPCRNDPQKCGLAEHRADTIRIKAEVEK